MVRELSKLKHLSENFKPFLLLNNEDRIKKLYSKRWIGYDVALDIIARIEQLISLPRKDRMPNLLLVGDTNNGKTEILKRILGKYPVEENARGEAKLIPVLMVQAPPEADEGRFYSNILRGFGVPFKDNERCSGKLSQIIKVAEQVKLNLLIVDEIHDIIAGSTTKQRVFRNAIKQLGTELRISIVAAGTREALNAINSDPQLSNRFHPAFIPKWNLNLSKEYNEEPFIRLLSSYSRTLPLWKASSLTDEATAMKLLSMSEGLIGELSDILSKAAEKAILTKKEKINRKLLTEIDWIVPSARNSQ